MLSFQMPCRFAGWAPGRELDNEEVAAVLEVEGDKTGIVSVGESTHTLVSRHALRRAEIERDAIRRGA